MMNPGGEAEMTAAVRAALDALAGRAVRRGRHRTRSDVLELVFVGNPIMHHLLLGIDPIELGGAPFALATDSAIELRAAELDLHSVNPGARVYVLPCIAGHVGADCAGVVLSETPWLNEEITLVVDVGTNAEIVLGNRDRLLACSSPTGPAFEGAQIGNGQRAAPGAIERVRIDRDTLEPRFKVIGCDLWSDEPGFAEATRGPASPASAARASSRRWPRCTSPGLITRTAWSTAPWPRAARACGPTGRTFAYLLHAGEPEIVVTPERHPRHPARQGRALCRRAPADGPAGRRDASAGSRWPAPSAAISTRSTPWCSGMIPDCPLDKVGSAGNAAGTGARIALLNRKARAEIEAVVERIEKVETAIEPRFQEHFVAAMAIPHKTAPYPNLAAAVTLPLAKERWRDRRRPPASAGGLNAPYSSRAVRPHGRHVEPGARIGAVGREAQRQHDRDDPDREQRAQEEEHGRGMVNCIWSLGRLGPLQFRGRNRTVVAGQTVRNASVSLIRIR